MEPIAGWNAPTPQLSQLTEATLTENIPAAHAAHEVASALVDPAAQLPQLVAPELDWYCPAAQVEHAADPCANEIVPAGQALQLDPPADDW